MKYILWLFLTIFPYSSNADRLDAVYYQLIIATGLGPEMSEDYVNEWASIVDEYNDQMAKVYASHFIVEEAQALIDFFNSPAGNKFLAKRQQLALKIEELRESLYGNFNETITEIYLSE
jgi:hypothetical protein